MRTLARSYLRASVVPTKGGVVPARPRLIRVTLESYLKKSKLTVKRYEDIEGVDGLATVYFNEEDADPVAMCKDDKCVFSNTRDAERHRARNHDAPEKEPVGLKWTLSGYKEAFKVTEEARREASVADETGKLVRIPGTEEVVFNEKDGSWFVCVDDDLIFAAVSSAIKHRVADHGDSVAVMGTRQVELTIEELRAALENSKVAFKELEAICSARYARIRELTAMLRGTGYAKNQVSRVISGINQLRNLIESLQDINATAVSNPGTVHPARRLSIAVMPMIMAHIQVLNDLANEAFNDLKEVDEAVNKMPTTSPGTE